MDLGLFKSRIRKNKKHGLKKKKIKDVAKE